MDKSNEFTENLELDAWNWIKEIILEPDFESRSAYQQDFLYKKSQKIRKKIEE